VPQGSKSSPQISTPATSAGCEVGPRSHTPHVLIICYDFPGIWAAGVIRTYQLAKNLPHFGWQPVILTAQRCCRDHEGNIEASDGDLQCAKITAAPPRWLVPFEIDHQRAPKPLDGAIGKDHSGLKHLGRFATQLVLPDGKIGWLRPAVQRALRIARDHPIRLCFSVSPRPTSHLVAYRVARRLHIPWVADYALPWSDAYWLAGRPRLISWLDHHLERLVVRYAQHITVAYADLARSICARYGSAWQEKISVVATGFAEDPFRQPSPSPSSKFTVVYPGNHFCEEGRHGEYFLRAIDEWIDLEPELAEKAAFIFIGKRDDDLLRQQAAMTHSRVIHVEPLASHRTCIQRIMSAHMCVVNTVGNRIPAKVYECMRAEKWILALTDPGSDLATLMQHYSKGVVVPARNTSAIRQALQDMARHSGTGTVESTRVDKLFLLPSAEHSAESLALIFERVSLISSRGHSVRRGESVTVTGR
jgi:glycosyltransferase involved in cell wall biosynthesis